ncbi:MAG: molecular chaperone HtpG [Oscillospiraceae bacterium]|nr:molecular chaperone HtpG [Oscillospiraceae bacterium]
MAKKQFKAESKKLLDMMINSIYTHKEIFLRELISNASDAIDKQYYHSLQGEGGLARDEYHIRLAADKENRTLTISDNGCGMSAKELEDNLGTIAKSGSLDFKKSAGDDEKKSDLEIIGQFGVGFYSAFMVSDKVTVETRKHGDDAEAYRWESKGADGYTIEKCDKEDPGTVITLHIKEDTEEEKYSEFLEEYTITAIVKKYSDYIRYPILMNVTSSRLKEGSEDEYEEYTEEKQLNSMVPIWRKNKNEITQEEYDNFYTEKFYDWEKPLHVIHSKTEGAVTYDALLYIPSHAPYDYYTKEYEKGLQLYSNGVLITDKCGELLPDYFSFVKGLVDSADLSLNISREALQHDHVLQLIARNVEKKIKSELKKLISSDREAYDKFFKAFGLQLKYGLYSDYGAHKDVLQDLVMFYSSSEKKLVTLEEYVSRMKEDQKTIYYACGETTDKIDMLPQTETVKDKGFEILYLTDDVDEFALKMLREYEGKTFTNICADKLDIETDEEKEQIKKENDDSKELLDKMKEAIGDGVTAVRFTSTLKNHPVCLTSEGEISLEMEKVLDSMPNDNKVKAQTVLEINIDHPIAEKLKQVYAEDPEAIAKYAKILYAQARLIGGMSIENPTELSNMICEMI